MRAPAGWLLAAGLGAYDGIILIASLILGAVSTGRILHGPLVPGGAGLVGSAMALAASRDVSVSSQVDKEGSAPTTERHDLTTDLAYEASELAGTYVSQGWNWRPPARSRSNPMARDALAAHARDELGISGGIPAQTQCRPRWPCPTGAAGPLALAVVSPAPLLVGHRHRSACLPGRARCHWRKGWWCASPQAGLGCHLPGCTGHGSHNWNWPAVRHDNLNKGDTTDG